MAAQMAAENRRFLRTALDYVLAQGITQYIDLGAGLPTPPAVHEMIRWHSPSAAVAYVDNNPVVLGHLHALAAKGDGSPRSPLASMFGTVRVTPVRLAAPGGAQPLPGRCRLVAAQGLPGALMPWPGWPRWRRRVAPSRPRNAAITGRCGPVMGKRQAGQAVVSAACDIVAFYARPPVPATASTLLVISADAKGIAMRPGALRPATARAAAFRARKVRGRVGRARPARLEHHRAPPPAAAWRCCPTGSPPPPARSSTSTAAPTPWAAEFAPPSAPAPRDLGSVLGG